MALKQEALQHLFIAIAGTECRELRNLLTLFFGKGSDYDPFEFLDAASAIKKLLDLVDTDSDDEASVADSSASTATTAPDPTAGSPKTPRPATPSSGASKDFKLLAKPPGPIFMLLSNWPRGLYPNQQAFYTTLVSRKGFRARDQTLRRPEVLASTYAHIPVVVPPPTLVISQAADRICVMFTTAPASYVHFVPIRGTTAGVGGRII